MKDTVEFYLTFSVINFITLLVILGTLIYLLQLKIARENLGWVFFVLSMLVTTLVSEQVLAGISIMQLRQQTLGVGGYVSMGVLCLIGGFTYNVSFAVFAIEYYKAAYTIAMSK
jgi:hypothetical protein